MNRQAQYERALHQAAQAVAAVESAPPGAPRMRAEQGYANALRVLGAARIDLERLDGVPVRNALKAILARSGAARRKAPLAGNAGLKSKRERAQELQRARLIALEERRRAARSFPSA